MKQHLGVSEAARCGSVTAVLPILCLSAPIPVRISTGRSVMTLTMPQLVSGKWNEITDGR